MASKQDGGTFTARDFELLAVAMTCTKTPVEIDYKLFAEKAGLKGANSGKASWHGVKKKIDRMASGAKVGPSLTITDPDKTEGSKKASAKGGKKRASSESDDENEGADGDEEVAESSKKAPAKKKGRKAPIGEGAKGKGKGKAAAAATNDEDDDEEIPVGVKGENED